MGIRVSVGRRRPTGGCDSGLGLPGDDLGVSPASPLPFGPFARQGAPLLWSTNARGIEAVASCDGRARITIGCDAAPGTLLVDSGTEMLWVLCRDGWLRSYTIAGRLGTSTRLGAPHAAPLAALDSQSQRLWIAKGHRLWLLDYCGSVLRVSRLDGGAIAMALDRRNSRLWLATSRSVTVRRNDGAVLMRAANRSRIRALAYDLDCDRLWIVGADFAGGPVMGGAITSLSHQPPPIISCDGTGGAWIASRERLCHVDAAGQTSLVAECSTCTEHITSLVADPGDQSAWIATNRRMLHCFVDGRVSAEVRTAEPTTGITLPIAPIPPEFRCIEPSRAGGPFNHLGIAAISNESLMQAQPTGH